VSVGGAEGRLHLVSRREREVLDLLGEHLTHEQIAQHLFLSVRTVESHVASLRRKLGLPEHRALVRFATALRPVLPGDRARPPVPLTSFIGREDDRRALLSALAGARLVTAVGAGGVGKTRLALAVASELGARWIDLVPITDVVGLEEAVAGAFGAVPTSGLGPLDAAIVVIGDAEAVLVLDNAEHLSDQVAVVAERLLTACRGLRILATSRVRIAAPFERIVHVEGLATGPDDAAVALFAERAVAAGAAAISPDERQRVAAICEALGGLPLAIELAAVRVPAVGLDGVERGLADQTQLLRGGPRASARHRSMSETLDWSVELLSPVAAACLRRLAVFITEFDGAAAAAVTGFAPLSPEAVGSALGDLLDHSLLSAVPSTAPRRFRMLEPVRQYAQSRLRGDDAPAFTHHLEWCRQQLDATGDGDIAWLEPLADEVRAALGRVGVGLVTAQPAADLARSFALLLYRNGSLREAQARWEQAASYEEDVTVALRDLAAAAATAKCRVLGDEALRVELAAVGLAHAHGDTVGEALAYCRAAELLIRFPGMFSVLPDDHAGELLDRARMLAGDDPGVRTVASVVELGYASEDHTASVERAQAAVAMAIESGDLDLESSARDALVVRYLATSMTDAHHAAQERVQRTVDWRGGPAAGLELKDALHVAVFTAIGAGHLHAAYDAAQRLARLPLLRERRDLAEDELIAPAVLAGDFGLAFDVASRSLPDWTAAGRPAAPGRALVPSAMAAACGLTGDGGGREQWLAILAEMRGVPPHEPWRGSGHGEVFEALVLLHHGRSADAFDALAAPPRQGLYYAVFAQWAAALAAEAAVLARRGDAAGWLSAAFRTCTGNPVATAITRRAELVHTHGASGFDLLAEEFAAGGWAYQADRTRRLHVDGVAGAGH